MSIRSRIYFDHGATTPVDKKVMHAMLPYFSRVFGNASSIHIFGSEASEAVEKARRQTADFFGAEPNEIIFTSGATESNNLAIKGVIEAYKRSNPQKPHIITTAFEHHCVLEACQNLEKNESAEVTYLKPDKDGLISAEQVKSAIKQNTVLVSTMYVNNEIGTIQPIKEIGSMIRAYKQKAKSYKLLFHTDATQAINYLNCNVDKLGVDLLSMSAHKIYGPKGVGALYIRKNTPISRVQDGGAQEAGKRAGTLNVPGIVGLGAAINELTTNNKQRTTKRLAGLRNYLIDSILKEIPEAKLNGSKTKRSPNNVNFSFTNVEGESLLMMLSAAGIACSTGSACSSGSLEPSHVLLAIGRKPEEAHGSLRITLGKDSSKKETEKFIRELKRIVSDLRKISGGVLSDYYSNKKLNIKSH